MDIGHLEALRKAPVPPAFHIIDGERFPASDGGELTVTSPIDGTTLTTMPRGTAEDANRAIAAPTIVTGVEQTDCIMRDEVFGPVVTVQAFDTEDEAGALANDGDFGLAAGVWTANLARAYRMIRRIRGGVVHVNTYGGADVTVLLGGVKQSGNGHDKSLHAFDKYFDLKTAWIKL